jgi:tetratricopeptide (TPR) repeat protein
VRYASKQDWRKAAKAYREAIALRPDEPGAYYNLGAALCNSGHFVEAAQRFLEAKERHPVGSEGWAKATAVAFDALRQGVCAEVAKPEWWSDEALKALSARVLRAAPNAQAALDMRANVLSGLNGAWEAGPRSAAELKEAATCFYRSAALCDAPAWKAESSRLADECRIRAEAL